MTELGVQRARHAQDAVHGRVLVAARQPLPHPRLHRLGEGLGLAGHGHQVAREQADEDGLDQREAGEGLLGEGPTGHVQGLQDRAQLLHDLPLGLARKHDAIGAAATAHARVLLGGVFVFDDGARLQLHQLREQRSVFVQNVDHGVEAFPAQRAVSPGL